MRCAHGDGHGPVLLLAGREAEARTVGALLDRTPVVACPHGHEAPAPVADAVIAHVRSTLTFARRRRLRPDACGDCGASLEMPVRRTERAVTLDDVGDVPICTVTFDLPSTRCADCGADQVPTRSAGDVDDVVRELFSPG